MKALTTVTVAAITGKFSPGMASATHYTPEACAELECALPGKVIYPNSTAYASSNTFWSSRQSDLEPSCFVQPSSASDVSTAVSVLTALSAPFTVKSGGHNAFPGASNIQDGVSIDLGALNSINLSENRKTVSVGAGARWINVTTHLDPLGLAVVGGRSPDVGVAGLTLGGGISFLSGHHGWACDNVANFEVVLASGEIVDASPEVNTDLYWALRGGGGSSFGIVTRFDLYVYEQKGDVWLRQYIWGPMQWNAPLGEFARVTREVLPEDRDAHVFFTMFYDSSIGEDMVAVFAYHLTHAQTGSLTPDVYEGFQRIPQQISNTTLVASISGQLENIPEPYGLRKSWFTNSVRDGPGIMTLFADTVGLWREHLEALRAEAEVERNSTIGMFFIVQPISVTTLEAMQKNGGNALGLETGDYPVFNIHAQVSWADPSLDDLVQGSLSAFSEHVDRLAGEGGFSNDFKYMNYAGESQDVFSGYGEDNVARLREVATKYDPKGHFQSLWKGYFKLR